MRVEAERQDVGRTLADVAGEAGVSTQAVAGALDLRLVDLTIRVAGRLTEVRGSVCLAA